MDVARYYVKSLIISAGWDLLVLGSAFLIFPGMFDPPPWDLLWILMVFGWLGPATAHVLFTRRIKGPERWRVRQHADILVALPATDAFESCVAAMWDVPRLKKERVQGTGRVEGRTRGTSWRWGDRIRCDVIPLDGRHARVLVSSRPASRWHFADYGSNWKNVLAIGHALGAPVSG